MFLTDASLTELLIASYSLQFLIEVIRFIYVIVIIIDIILLRLLWELQSLADILCIRN